MGDIPHKPTVGALREEYLTELFLDFIPDSVSITSGFIADALGNISPQLDLIVIQKASLPLIAMKQGLSIVPIESALAVAEIKSMLTTTDLEQVKYQNEAIAKMKLSVETEKFVIPTLLLAYDTKVASETLKLWMRENRNTVACCILKKDTYFKKSEDIEVFENEKFNIRHYGVLTFVASFHKSLKHLVSQRNFDPNLDFYLTWNPKIE